MSVITDRYTDKWSLLCNAYEAGPIHDANNSDAKERRENKRARVLEAYKKNIRRYSGYNEILSVTFILRSALKEKKKKKKLVLINRIGKIFKIPM